MPFAFSRIEDMQVIQILGFLSRVVETTEKDDQCFPQDHTMTGTRAWFFTNFKFFPGVGFQVERPEIFVVEKGGLIGGLFVAS
jgi:hypothetical protein